MWTDDRISERSTFIGAVGKLRQGRSISGRKKSAQERFGDIGIEFVDPGELLRQRHELIGRDFTLRVESCRKSRTGRAADCRGKWRPRFRGVLLSASSPCPPPA